MTWLFPVLLSNLMAIGAIDAPDRSPGRAQEKPREIALRHLREHPGQVGATAADIDDVVVSSEQTTGSTGLTNVYLRQRYQGIDVSGADVTVNVDRNGQVISAVGEFVPNLAGAIHRPRTPIAPADAVDHAAKHLELRISVPLKVVRKSSGPMRETVLTRGGISARNIPAHLVFHRKAPGDLRLAWVVEIEQTDSVHWWVVTVDAETGAVLAKFNRITSAGAASS